MRQESEANIQCPISQSLMQNAVMHTHTTKYKVRRSELGANASWANASW